MADSNAAAAADSNSNAGSHNAGNFDSGRRGGDVDRVAELLRGGRRPEDDDADDLAGAGGSDNQDGGDADVTAREGAPGGDDDADAGEAGGSREKPRTLDELAERAGITLDELYKLKLPMKDGREPIVLGEAKDQLLEVARLGDQRNELDDRRADFEREMTRAKQELQQVVSLLPEIPPELAQRAKQQHVDHARREIEQLLDVKPEWQDPDKWELAKRDMLQAVGEWGFTRADFDSILDHRLTLMVHDYARLKRRFAEANATLKELRKGKGGERRRERARGGEDRRSDPTLERNKQRAQQGDRAAQVAAVGALINQQGN